MKKQNTNNHHIIIIIRRFDLYELICTACIKCISDDGNVFFFIKTNIIIKLFDSIGYIHFIYNIGNIILLGATFHSTALCNIII